MTIVIWTLIVWAIWCAKLARYWHTVPIFLLRHLMESESSLIALIAVRELVLHSTLYSKLSALTCLVARPWLLFLMMAKALRGQYNALRFILNLIAILKELWYVLYLQLIRLTVFLSLNTLFHVCYRCHSCESQTTLIVRRAQTFELLPLLAIVPFLFAFGVYLKTLLHWKSNWLPIIALKNLMFIVAIFRQKCEILSWKCIKVLWILRISLI